MKIIIAGAGEVGTHLAKMLSNEDQDIILLDSDQNKLDNIDSRYNLMTWNGSTYSFQTMRDMGVEDSDLFIAVTPYETTNITSCAIAKRLGATKTVARIDNPEFLENENLGILKDIGADFLIYPERLAADEINLSLEHNWARYWGELHGGALLLVGVKLREGAKLVDMKLYELPTVSNHHFHVAAIKRNNRTIIPSGNDELRAGDIAYFITMPAYCDELTSLCGKTKRDIRKVMILGGSRIAIRFAKQYHDKYKIRIIDGDRANCEKIATALPDVDIICSDVRDYDTLRENRVYDYDAFLALTDSSEANILSCMTAKDFSVPKTLADVENIQFLSQAENLNIGTTINKKLLASSRIFKILLDADKSNTKFLALADAEVAEMYVKEHSRITRKPVMNLSLPREMTLAALVRDDECMLIDGHTRILPGDYVVVFCLSGFFRQVEKWFS